MRYAGAHKHLVRTDRLFSYEEPVSPHLAAQLASESNWANVRPYCIPIISVLFLRHL
jgi:dethiobiotin synthetase/adenosylmethionine--8-amino-7-oxononanoate aminotransferase